MRYSNFINMPCLAPQKYASRVNFKFVNILVELGTWGYFKCYIVKNANFSSSIR